MAAVLLISFFVMVFLNVPIAASLGLSSLFGIIYGGYPISMLPGTMFASIGKFALLAIPFFILAGVIMERAGISEKLIDFAEVMVGHRKSGLISVVVIVSCFFAAISGSGPATVAALGSVLIPAMIKQGYEEGLASALMASSGAIGIIIPPSIAFVVYASIADASIAKLFMGGIIPGIVLGVAYVFAAMYGSRNSKNITLRPKATGAEKWKSFKQAFWGLLTPIIILGGIYSGIFTPTESAGVAVVYGLIVGIFIYKKIKIKDLPGIFVESAISSATVMYIIATASVFAWILTTSHIAGNISDALINIAGNKYIAIIIMNIIFLIAGCFMDANSAFYILIPIMLPVIQNFGLDPIHVGVFLTVNMAIGQITPPVGINLYVASNVSGASITDTIKNIIPFIVFGVIALLIISFIPQITMVIPNLMK